MLLFLSTWEAIRPKCGGHTLSLIFAAVLSFNGPLLPKSFFSLISYSLKYRVVDFSNPLGLQMAVLSIFLFSYACKPVYYCMSVSRFSNILLSAASKRNLCPCMLSRFSCVPLFATPWTISLQASLSMGFSRQEYWRGSPFPSPGDLPNPEIESTSMAPA